jgi:hypothetical protein
MPESLRTGEPAAHARCRYCDEPLDEDADLIEEQTTHSLCDRCSLLLRAEAAEWLTGLKRVDESKKEQS